MPLGYKKLLRVIVSIHNLLTFPWVFLLASCLDSDSQEDIEQSQQSGESSINRIQKLKDQELLIDSLTWENSRLSLKLIRVDGGGLVMDKKTGLWHYDVERVPFTGRASEVFPDSSPRGEADFLNGRKDGMERFWWPNGKLKEQGQWFDGRANGLFRSWNEQGKLIKVIRYKNGELIEIILE